MDYAEIINFLLINEVYFKWQKRVIKLRYMTHI